MLKPKWLWLLVTLCFLLVSWTISGFESVYFDTDIGRDLKEISNIQAGDVVWLGPKLQGGTHASSSFYYFFWPAIEAFNGHPHGLIVFNVLCWFITFVLLGWLSVRRYGLAGNLIPLVLGSLPLVFTNVLHPGNGYTHLVFVIAALAWLWYEFPLVGAGLLIGLATAFHPTSFVLWPFLMYEWWRQKPHWWHSLAILLAFLLPWAPLILFEVITKGYLLRTWIEQPATAGVSLRWTLANWQLISYDLRLPIILFGGIWLLILGFVLTTKRSRLCWWGIMTLGLLLSFGLLDNMIGRYLWPMTLVVAFYFLIVSMTRTWTKVALLIFAGVLLSVSPVVRPLPVATRTMSQVVAVVEALDQTSVLDKHKPLAVVATLTQQTEVPQADDYRFLLRNRGYTVVEADQHAQAQTLVYFIEVPDFKWQNWSTWESESFGAKEYQKRYRTPHAQIIVFTRP